MTTPRITFFSCTRNSEEYAAACIQSVLAQTCGDWEMFYVDDASTDATMDAAQAAAQGDPRITLVRRRHRIGLMANFMWVARRSRATLLSELAGDDALYGHDVLSRVLAIYDADSEVDGTYGGCHIAETDVLYHPGPPYPVDRGMRMRLRGWDAPHLRTWRKAITLDSMAREPEAYEAAIARLHAADAIFFGAVVVRARKLVCTDSPPTYRFTYTNPLSEHMVDPDASAESGQIGIDYWRAVEAQEFP